MNYTNKLFILVLTAFGPMLLASNFDKKNQGFAKSYFIYQKQQNDLNAINNVFKKAKKLKIIFEKGRMNGSSPVKNNQLLSGPLWIQCWDGLIKNCFEAKSLSFDNTMNSITTQPNGSGFQVTSVDFHQILVKSLEGEDAMGNKFFIHTRTKFVVMRNKKNDITGFKMNTWS